MSRSVHACMSALSMSRYVQVSSADRCMVSPHYASTVELMESCGNGATIQAPAKSCATHNASRRKNYLGPVMRVSSQL